MIDTVPLGDMAEDMFGYFEPLYQVIPGMPRPPDAFLKRVAGETLARTLQVLSGLERGCRLAPLGLDCLPGAPPLPLQPCLQVLHLHRPERAGPKWRGGSCRSISCPTQGTSTSRPRLVLGQEGQGVGPKAGVSCDARPIFCSRASFGIPCVSDI